MQIDQKNLKAEKASNIYGHKKMTISHLVTKHSGQPGRQEVNAQSLDPSGGYIDIPSR